ncbi:hypothetical protein [Cupriavidus plantarum]|uniref:hypothetical protein n=1 Tax=Cupriavidus plantarum TaxID=942865 RepID=UPI000E39FB34|nr:hypothetical protein [Cupriavidus plantarum]REE93797.1 hypothetical protein C7418_2569 [Cupriavidus plantarum]
MYNMGTVVIQPRAQDDIMALSCVDPAAMGCVLALFRQLETDPAKFAQLLVNGRGSFKTDDFNVRKWVMAQDTGRALWRLKHLALEREGKFFRVVYCVSRDFKCAHVLAVVRVYDAKAEFDYDDPTNPLVRRVFDAYDALRGIST